MVRKLNETRTGRVGVTLHDTRIEIEGYDTSSPNGKGENRLVADARRKRELSDVYSQKFSENEFIVVNVESRSYYVAQFNSDRGEQFKVISLKQSSWHSANDLREAVSLRYYKGHNEDGILRPKHYKQLTKEYRKKLLKA